MTQLEPGPELDALLAKALGIDLAYHDKRFDDQSGDYTCEVCGKVNPPYNDKTCAKPFSTDWNAAMQAAEVCQLFGHHMLACDLGSHGSDALYFQEKEPEWQVVEYDDQQEVCLVFQAASTGQHAICLAILKLKEQPCP